MLVNDGATDETSVSVVVFMFVQDKDGQACSLVVCPGCSYRSDDVDETNLSIYAGATCYLCWMAGEVNQASVGIDYGLDSCERDYGRVLFSYGYV